MALSRGFSRKPKVRKTTMKNIADWGNRTLKPEKEQRLYEFANGMKRFKAGKGAYSTK